ncbi:MAG: DUF3124 domain-containing protein [Sandaracinaceae bacterium]
MLLGLVGLGVIACGLTRSDRAHPEPFRDEPEPPLGAGERPASSLHDHDDETPSGTLYVPVSSHVYYGDGSAKLLAVTLVIRNVSLDHELTIRRVDYVDSRGARVRALLDAPRRVGPLATEDFFVEQRDAAGGAGASFLIRWRGPPGAPAPLAQAVMVGAVGTAGISFRTVGIEIGPPERQEQPAAAPSPSPSPGGAEEP